MSNHQWASIGFPSILFPPPSTLDEERESRKCEEEKERVDMRDYPIIGFGALVLAELERTVFGGLSSIIQF